MIAFSLQSLVICFASWILSSGCTASSEGNRGSTGSQDSHCIRMATYGQRQYCLPQIEGMTECLNRPVAKNRSNIFIAPGNSTLGIYLTDAQAKDPSLVISGPLDDYFLIYSVNETAEVDFRSEHLDALVREMNSNTLKKNWNELKGRLKTALPELQVGQPVLLETNRPHPNVATNYYLNKMIIDEEETYSLMTLSICILKNRAICVSHTLAYKGETSLNQAKAKSDYFVLRFVAENS